MEEGAPRLSESSQTDCLVVGGGLAGLSAAIALAQAGMRVTVFERRPETGGRAYSYPHPALGEIVDSQHVTLGCCTNLVDLLTQANAEPSLRWYDELVFLQPDGPRTVLRPGSLPAPAHQTLGFLQAPMLALADKAGIARGLLHFLHGYPERDDEAFSTWLARTGQTERAIRHFWEPVVLGALNDDFERCSTKYAGKVFHETFLRSPAGGRLGIPRLPLTEFFEPVVRQARALGISVQTRAAVEELLPTPNGGWRVRVGEQWHEAPTVILAGDFRQASRLAGPALGPALNLDETAFTAAPITTVHLWFDRDVTDMDHAVLLDTRIQWMFNKSRIRDWEPERGSYLEFTISGSWPELKKSRTEILEPALREAELFFPAIREAKLLRSGVLKEARATFSVTPGLDHLRPAQKTALPGLFLAGDWTRTEWPSTMEGAVRSGRLAAGAVVGDPLRFLTDELPPSGLMRWLSTSHPPLSRS